MANFEPRKVPVKNYIDWLKGALELAARKPVTFISIWLIGAFVNYLLPDITPVHTPIAVLVLGLSCLAAEAADKSQPFYKLAAVRLYECHRTLILVALGFGLFTTAFGFLLQLAINGIEDAAMMFQLASSGEKWHTMSFAAKLLYSFDWLSIDASGFLGMFFCLGWFWVTLIVNAGATFGIAFNQSYRATLKNLYVIALVVLIQFLLDLFRIIPLAALPALSIVSGMIYLSYKDIWLGMNKVDSKVRKPFFKFKLAMH